MAPLPRLLPLLLLAACGSWPRYTALPTDEGVIPADQDPRAAVPVTWAETTEDDLLARDGADNGDPRNVTTTPLASLGGLAVTGSLRGAGWNSSFEAPTLEGDGCDPSSRSPGGDGDWAGDVDFVVIEIDAEAPAPVLCARASVGDDQVGWDLLLYPLDDCGLPEPPLSGDGEEPLGLGLAGSIDGWRAAVTPGATYGVLMAGYDAPDPLGDYAYTVGLSLVIDDDGRELCPLLPAEVSE